jgi:hypothetical protein
MQKILKFSIDLKLSIVFIKMTIVSISILWKKLRLSQD